MLPPLRPTASERAKAMFAKLGELMEGAPPGRLHAADQPEEVGTPRRFELTIRLTKKPPACAGGFVLLAKKVLIGVP